MLSIINRYNKRIILYFDLSILHINVDIIKS